MAQADGKNIGSIFIPLLAKPGLSERIAGWINESYIFSLFGSPNGNAAGYAGDEKRMKFLAGVRYFSVIAVIDDLRKSGRVRIGLGQYLTRLFVTLRLRGL